MIDESKIEQFSTEINRRCHSSFQQFKNHSYAAGYFQVVAQQMFTRLSAEDQSQFLQQIKESVDRIERLTQS